MPEWYLFSFVLGVFSALGFAWKPLFVFFPFFALALLIPITQALACARKATYPSVPQHRGTPKKLWAITAFLHLMQPLARLWGRLKHGLTPWRKHSWKCMYLPVRYKASLWTESWQSPEQWLMSLETAIKSQGAVVQRGADFDPWDLRVPGGVFSSLRICMAIEEHGGGKQLARFRASPRFSIIGIFLTLICAGLCAWACTDSQWIVGGFLGACTVMFIAWIVCEWAQAGVTLKVALEEINCTA